MTTNNSASRRSGSEPMLGGATKSPLTGVEPILGGERSFDLFVWTHLLDPRSAGKESVVASLSEAQGALYADGILNLLSGPGGHPDRLDGDQIYVQLLTTPQRASVIHSLGLLGRRFGGQLAARIGAAVVTYLAPSEDILIRVEAAKALGMCHEVTAEPVLIKVTNDTNWRVRRAALTALGELGGESSVVHLLRILDIPRSSNDAVCALESLGVLGSRLQNEAAQSIYERLMYVFARGGDTLQRGAAIRALGFLGDHRALDLLIEVAIHSRGEIQAAAIQSLGMFGSPEGVPPLIFALTNSGYTVRQDVIDALTRIGQPSIRPLMAVLRHPDPSIRRSAIEVLGKVKATDAVGQLIHLVTDFDADVRQAAVSALGLIGDPSAVEPLVSALGDPDPHVRKEAAMMLGVFRSEDAVGPLCLALWDLDVAVRWFAAYSLGAIRDVRAVQPLLHILSDPSEDVVNTAIDSLFRIGRIALVDLLNHARHHPEHRHRVQSIIDRFGMENDG